MSGFANSITESGHYDSASYAAGEPITVRDEGGFWNGDTDVIVIGLGAAGASAAIEARAGGKQVMVLERFEGGGATALSGGIYYGGATEQLRAAGFADSVDEMYSYLKNEIDGAVQDTTLRDFCNSSAENLKWLEAQGVEFGCRVDEEKRSYPRVGYDLYYSGNERASSNKKLSKPAPRGHRVSGKGFTGGVLAEKLIQSAIAQGVDVRLQARVRRLIVGDSGEIVGAEALVIPSTSRAALRHKKLIRKVNKYQRFLPHIALNTLRQISKLEDAEGVLCRIKASKGVILATGSFAFNRAMINRYAPNYINAMPVGTVGCDGSGIRLGQSVGGAVSYMDRVSAWRSISPPSCFVKGIIVNREGRRFSAEDSYLGHIGRAIVEQQNDSAWIIIEKSELKQDYLETLPRVNSGWLSLGAAFLVNLIVNLKKSSSLEGLAKACGIDASGLVDTVAGYNKMVDVGIDEFEKASKYLKKIGSGSYYALSLSTKNPLLPCPSIPMGGLSIDEMTGSVLREDGSAIKGLYAAGRCAVGIPSGFYISGTAVADCVYSGRRAAKHICST